MDRMISEVRSQRSEVRSQKTEVRSQSVVSVFCFLTSVFCLLISISAFAEEVSFQGFLQTDYSTRITGVKLPGAKRQELILGEERGRLEGSYYPSNSKIGFDVKGDVFHD